MYGISAYICAKFVVNEKKHTIYDIYMDPMGDDFRLMISVEEKTQPTNLTQSPTSSLATLCNTNLRFFRMGKSDPGFLGFHYKK